VPPGAADDEIVLQKFPTLGNIRDTTKLDLFIKIRENERKEPHSMESNGWVPALSESQLRDDTVNLVSAKGVSIILIKRGASIYALRNRCAHMSCTLAGGRLDGDTIQCPCHEWKFDITTGEFIDAREIKVQTYVCKSENGQIQVKMEE